ncbi:uncharacterized protein LOC111630287 [Centruroides sculpturatus]|uniref:uncharacterized protein LOC111630287 n=1 Tax=Centruroides sculpturatus TaxID=218467 RepID=UPI000C6D1C76|nr:uncharacterized protein LOC111630287 [Centruroides sculpturatus]
MEEEEVQEEEEKDHKNFFKTSYGMLRIAELVFSIGGLLAIEESVTCGKFFRTQFFMSACISAIVFTVIFLTCFFFKIIDYLSEFLNLGIVLFVIDLIFTIMFAISSFYIIFTIKDCKEFRFARISASFFGVFNLACFFSTTSTDFRWFYLADEPY